MLKLIFWKVSLKGKTFTFIGVPPIVMAVVVIITVGVIAVVMAVGMAAAVIMTPGKGSGKNPKKSSPRRKRGFPSGLLTREGAQMGVISAPLNVSPAQKE